MKTINADNDTDALSNLLNKKLRGKANVPGWQRMDQKVNDFPDWYDVAHAQMPFLFPKEFTLLRSRQAKSLWQSDKMHAWAMGIFEVGVVKQNVKTRCTENGRKRVMVERVAKPLEANEGGGKERKNKKKKDANVSRDGASRIRTKYLQSMTTMDGWE